LTTIGDPNPAFQLADTNASHPAGRFKLPPISPNHISRKKKRLLQAEAALDPPRHKIGRDVLTSDGRKLLAGTVTVPRIFTVHKSSVAVGLG